MPLHKKLVKGFLIYQPARGRSSYAHAGFGLCQGSRLSIQRVSSVSGVCKVMKSDAGEKFIEGDVLDPQGGRHLGYDMRIMGKDTHFHCQGAVGDNRADVPETCDAQGLVIKLRAYKFLLFPQPMTH